MIDNHKQALNDAHELIDVMRGDLIAFIQHYHNLSFGDALKRAEKLLLRKKKKITPNRSSRSSDRGRTSCTS